MAELSEQTCQQCGRVDRATRVQRIRVERNGNGSWLCNDCWHKYRTTSRTPFEIVDDYGQVSRFTGTLAECGEALASELTFPPHRAPFTIRQASAWRGDERTGTRVAHPCFLDQPVRIEKRSSP